MKLGAIQKDVVAFLSRCGEEGGYIGATSRANEFRGYSLEQVERAIARLLHRRIIERKGIRYRIIREKNMSEVIRRMPEPILRSTTAQFSLGHLIFSRETNEVKEFWEGDSAVWLCGHRLPPFQRPAVWSEAQSIRFIESAWLGFHLGTYVVNRDDRWVKAKNPAGMRPHHADLWLIDGQQRLRALDRYLGDEFPVFGYHWSELDRVEQRRFDSVPFAQSIIREADEAKLRELYDRLNFGGTSHTEDQRAS